MTPPRTSNKIKPVTRWMLFNPTLGSLGICTYDTDDEAELRKKESDTIVRVRITPIEPKPKKRSAKR